MILKVLVKLDTNHHKYTSNRRYKCLIGSQILYHLINLLRSKVYPVYFKHQNTIDWKEVREKVKEKLNQYNKKYMIHKSLEEAQ
jgi:hypothetical protein